jgi:fructose-bisphosphate aldolase class 1
METEIINTAKTLMATDKGLLAMDESDPTCNKRFAKLGIPQTADARRAYRELIVTAPGLGESISGAILFDETIRQQKKDGTPFAIVLATTGTASLHTLSKDRMPNQTPSLLQNNYSGRAEKSKQPNAADVLQISPSKDGRLQGNR